MSEETFALFGPNQQHYPGRYVLRRFHIEDGLAVSDPRPRGVHPDPDVLRKLIPAQLSRRERSAQDDPSRIETWYR